MDLMISITTRRQTQSRSWIWDRKRPVEAAATAPEGESEPTEAIIIKPASWPRPRASWLPPQA